METVEEVGRGHKEPFDIERVLVRLRAAVAPYRPAAMFALRDEGFGTVFQQLAACIISIRTRDEVTLPASLRLLRRASTPEKLSRLSLETLDSLIHPCTFHEAKAVQLQRLAKEAVERLGGEVPCDKDVLLSFHGGGVKCAHLALGVACGEPFISVDVHVHRVTNRWGYVHTRSPAGTVMALEEQLPERHWIDLNRLLVPFGKHVCTGRAPKCSTCPVLSMCRQVGVTTHR